MKRIAKKLCSTVCALLAFSGNRGGALTKEILCNTGQWFACLAGCVEIFDCFYVMKKNKNKNKKEIVPRDNGSRGKILSYLLLAATVGNTIDAAKRSYDIAHNIIKGSNSKSDTTNKKESKNYWPTLEAIFGVFQLAFSNHDIFYNNGCHFCTDSMLQLLGGSALLADAYFRYRESNQTNNSSNLEKNSNTNNIQAQKPKNEH